MNPAHKLPPTGWLALIAVPQLELLAERVLDACGYRVWVPRALVERRHARRRVTLEVPLWMGYVLLRLEPRQCLEHVLSMRSILDVVRGEDGKPLAIAPADMARAMDWVGDRPVDLRPRLLAEHVAARKAPRVWLAGPMADGTGRTAMLEALARNVSRGAALPQAWG